MGSLFYTTYKGAAEVEFNEHDRLRRDGDRATTSSDDGPDVLADFIETAEFPVISGNTVIAGAERLGVVWLTNGRCSR